ncbi:phage pre-tape measure protein [Sinorhizobium meliloti]|uniref:phage pre-tape measure protein n=1 Tax=Rhizobium meliloti TaxID=382 RepID=UPI0001E4A633|nr:hypothetical protein [Sinorhizobium meliloti]AEG53115.1 hypothetical protein Sinme_1368 [Sinorhizobium meliloti AK83]MDE4591171.1 hypothetical protein [Sinorhizobium meliloti]SEI55499.1 hypothetical protein SAMN04244575_01016 [Sinorhizobium meliloti]
MPLNYTLKYDSIKFTGGELSVRGLTVPDITQLVHIHQDAALSIYDRFKDPKMLGEGSVESVAQELLGKFPSVVAHLIALAADEPHRLDDYAKLPIDVQVAALEKIAILTFAMEGGLKNFIETVTRIAASAGGLTDQLRLPLA